VRTWGATRDRPVLHLRRYWRSPDTKREIANAFDSTYNLDNRFISRICRPRRTSQLWVFSSDNRWGLWRFIGGATRTRRPSNGGDLHDGTPCSLPVPPTWALLALLFLFCHRTGLLLTFKLTHAGAIPHTARSALAGQGAACFFAGGLLSKADCTHVLHSYAHASTHLYILAFSFLKAIESKDRIPDEPVYPLPAHLFSHSCACDSALRSVFRTKSRT
jgi:hypothetical protein